MSEKVEIKYCKECDTRYYDFGTHICRKRPPRDPKPTIQDPMERMADTMDKILDCLVVLAAHVLPSARDINEIEPLVGGKNQEEPVSIKEEGS